tara:strand:- start:1034 stop:1624 length:591 start_codon:yes stop_codon:yes gene_type:complete
MVDTIQAVLFKVHSQKAKPVTLYKELCNIQTDNIELGFESYKFNCDLMKKYNVKLELLHSLNYEEEMFHFIGITMKQIEKKDYLPKDKEVNKKEFWWENIYDKNYSLICGDIIVIRYNTDGHIDNMSPEDYNILENLIIQPEDLNSDDEDSRTSFDLESTDEDYVPDVEDETDDEDEEYYYDEHSEEEDEELLIEE